MPWVDKRVALFTGWCESRTPKAFSAVVSILVCGVFASGCANTAAPPGGPPDSAPPMVVSITPASGSMDIRPKEVEIRFDEVISETPRGAQNLQSLVFISPRSGDPRVSWKRNRILIRPRDGFRDSTVYTVELRPGIMDLSSNQLDSAVRIVFSTGGEIPQTRVSGAVFDWVAGKPAPQALVEAITEDSTTYQTLADSAGRFVLEHLPTTRLVLRAIIDRNNNRQLERLEPWDTAGIFVTADVTTDLYAFQHDTLPMRVQSVSYIDSLAELRVVFDKPFAPSAVFTPSMFTLTDRDSVPLTISTVVSIRERTTADSLKRIERQDSIARAQQDTTAEGRARADSIARKNAADSVVAAQRAEEARRREALLRRGRPQVAVDTTPPPKLQRPVPFSELILVLADKLDEAASYQLRAEGLQSISGVTAPTPPRNFNTPKRQPVVPPDSGKIR